MSLYNTLNLAMRNKAQLTTAKNAGCYQCGKIFDTKEIKEFTDQGETALCPYCEIDSVIAETNIKLSEEYLKAIKEFWTVN
ncbi:MAG: cytoplasmic protein [Crenarchaeota archaeon]|nr:MAG: cytoplasmic protein [Thermoproteota archaeon]